MAGESWVFDNKPIEFTNDFVYLGTVCNYTGIFSLNHEYLAGKAVKALNVLLSNYKKLPLKPKLFDSFIGSIFGYTSEVWGNCKSKTES